MSEHYPFCYLPEYTVFQNYNDFVKYKKANPRILNTPEFGVGGMDFFCCPVTFSDNIGMKIFKKYFNRYTDKNPTHYILYYERNDIRDGFDPFSYTNDYNVPRI